MHLAMRTQKWNVQSGLKFESGIAAYAVAGSSVPVNGTSPAAWLPDLVKMK